MCNVNYPSPCLFSGDVTGNDGVYTAYLVGLVPTGNVDDVTISVSADDNNGEARLVKVSAAARSAPLNPDQGTVLY